MVQLLVVFLALVLLRCKIPRTDKMSRRRTR
nr:MAG TPA: hypothetical protein [Microviridae sp.]